MSRPLILASQSPQRRQLLKSLGIPFRIVASNVSEKTKEKNPRRIVSMLALRKAIAVAQRRPQRANTGRTAPQTCAATARRQHPLVLGADTIVVCRGKILGKPKNARDAIRILSTLNGRWQRVYTGVALIDSDSGRSWKEIAVSRVKARKLDSDALRRLAGKHMDKAGAYALQDGEDPFIEKVIGPIDNVIGLPMASVRSLIRKAARNHK